MILAMLAVSQAVSIKLATAISINLQKIFVICPSRARRDLALQRPDEQVRLQILRLKQAHLSTFSEGAFEQVCPELMAGAG